MKQINSKKKCNKLFNNNAYKQVKTKTIIISSKCENWHKTDDDGARERERAKEKNAHTKQMIKCIYKMHKVFKMCCLLFICVVLSLRFVFEND